MRPECAKFLRDIFDATGRIERYTRGKTLGDYLADDELRDAVQWNFLTIGEARAQLEKIDDDIARQVNEHRRIIGFRNQLIHGYGVIKNEITWDIVQNKLPVLAADVQRLLGE